jgi:hypothetical protein
MRIRHPVNSARVKITCLDGVESLPDHGHNRARGHVGDKAGKEGLLGQVGVVLLQVLLGGLQKKEINLVDLYVLRKSVVPQQQGRPSRNC